jgi:hypothetical protein
MEKLKFKGLDRGDITRRDGFEPWDDGDLATYESVEKVLTEVLVALRQVETETFCEELYLSPAGNRINLIVKKAIDNLVER